MTCRHCGTPLQHTFLDLGFAPPSNAYLTEEDLHRPEPYFPLRVKVCDQCWLVQTEDYAPANDLFKSDYAYFSSTSSGWLAHAANYSKQIIERLALTSTCKVVEIASNDGYLLKNFLAAGIDCLGIEPTHSTADVAQQLGIPVCREFFGGNLSQTLASQGQQADLIIGNNVYAHVPDINDFTKGLKTLLKPSGTITLEFPHLLRLIENNQFDTIYHEHFSYLSLNVVDRIFRSEGLRVYDVEQLSTHGGSLRIYGCHGDATREVSENFKRILKEEENFGLNSLDPYIDFQNKANIIKNELNLFLINNKLKGKFVAGYGAAAKGNTLLNYGGVRTDLLPFICDAAPSKQGMFMPGSHIPIFSPEKLAESPPDFLLILPWNIATEIQIQNQILLSMGTKFVTAVPKLEIL